MWHRHEPDTLHDGISVPLFRRTKPVASHPESPDVVVLQLNKLEICVDGFSPRHEEGTPPLLVAWFEKLCFGIEKKGGLKVDDAP